MERVDKPQCVQRCHIDLRCTLSVRLPVCQLTPLAPPARLVVSATWSCREWHDHVFGPLEVASLGQRVPSVYARPLTDGEQPAAKGSVRGVKPHRSVTWGTYSPQSGYYTVSLASVRPFR